MAPSPSCASALTRAWGSEPHSKTVLARSIWSYRTVRSSGPSGQIDHDGGRGVVGGDERAGDPALVVTDVGQTDGDHLADLAPEVVGGAQRPLDAGTGDLERVVAGHGVVVIELAGHQPAGQCQVVERHPGGRAGGCVQRDAQRAATLLDVVEVEAEVGGDGRDQFAHARQHGAVGEWTHIDLLSRNEAWADAHASRLHATIDQNG